MYPIPMVRSSDLSADVRNAQLDRDRNETVAYNFLQAGLERKQNLENETWRRGQILYALDEQKKTLARALETDANQRNAARSLLKSIGVEIPEGASKELLESTWDTYWKHRFTMQELFAKTKLGRATADDALSILDMVKLSKELGPSGAAFDGQMDWARLIAQPAPNPVASVMGFGQRKVAGILGGNAAEPRSGADTFMDAINSTAMPQDQLNAVKTVIVHKFGSLTGRSLSIQDPEWKKAFPVPVLGMENIAEGTERLRHQFLDVDAALAERKVVLAERKGDVWSDPLSLYLMDWKRSAVLNNPNLANFPEAAETRERLRAAGILPVQSLSPTKLGSQEPQTEKPVFSWGEALKVGLTSTPSPSGLKSRADYVSRPARWAKLRSLDGVPGDAAAKEMLGILRDMTPGEREEYRVWLRTGQASQ
jgi:hypothetical protein